MRAFSNVALVIVLAGMMYVSAREAYTFSDLPETISRNTFGGEICDHEDDELYCTTGTQECSGACEGENTLCDVDPDHQLKASEGSIYVCAATGTENQIDCDETEGTQTCKVTHVCKCKDTLTGGLKCKSEALATPANTTKPNVESTTQCTNS